MARPKKNFAPTKESPPTNPNLAFPVKQKTTVAELAMMSQDCSNLLEQIRTTIMNPLPRKEAPKFNTNEVCEVLGFDRKELKSAESSLGTNFGTLKPGENQKTYELEEVIQFVEMLGLGVIRPEGKNGKVIAIASYKGGVGKTTSSITIAQGMTLRGLKVLLIDLDAQGSATHMMGISPELEVDEEATVMPYFYGDQENLLYAPLKTYWHNLDLIPAASCLLGAEYQFAADLAADPTIPFWTFLNKGLEPLREYYDAIVLDCPPSLSFITQNAMFAADGILAPCPTQSLDFASLSQFWQVYLETSRKPEEHRSYEDDESVLLKEFDFVEVFVNKGAPEKDERAAIVKQWLKKAYKDHLCDIQIPYSVAAEKANTEFKTIYEIGKKDVSPVAYKRYKVPIDALVNHVCAELSISWGR